MLPWLGLMARGRACTGCEHNRHGVCPSWDTWRARSPRAGPCGAAQPAPVPRPGLGRWQHRRQGSGRPGGAPQRGRHSQQAGGGARQRAADASLDAGDAAVRPRFLPWCRSAQAETRALNYALNGSALALVLVASATELAELVRGDFFSAHAGLEAMRGFLNQGWEAYAHAVDSHPVSTKARASPFKDALPSKLPLLCVVGTSAHCWVSA